MLFDEIFLGKLALNKCVALATHTYFMPIRSLSVDNIMRHTLMLSSLCSRVLTLFPLGFVILSSHLTVV